MNHVLCNKIIDSWRLCGIQILIIDHQLFAGAVCAMQSATDAFIMISALVNYTTHLLHHQQLVGSVCITQFLCSMGECICSENKWIKKRSSVSGREELDSMAWGGMTQTSPRLPVCQLPP